MRSLSDFELDQVSGGLLFVPLAIAFGKGLLVGSGVAGFGLIVADAAGLIEN